MMDEVIDRLLNNTRERLLAERTESGHWEGELSSSALSTATAVIALGIVDSSAHADLIERGRCWLESNVNPDGGWGDTTLSFSNISTTLLCRSALGVCGQNDSQLARNADAWIKRYAGSMNPDDLCQAVVARYGKDKTFSVPILMACAIGGLLGSDPKAAWKRVLPLPFELAVFPRSWFGALRLPVVSYALPALIAIGYARSWHAPPLPPWCLVRKTAWRRASVLLDEIQPENGGFLEATPLTSFVTMALASSGQAEHSVVTRALKFLQASVREDGSWPIDTNLATWGTTLAIKSLDDPLALGVDDRQRLLNWLLSQQYRVRHAYTDAPPGGWAWTDLPGGVPDADDTSGALLAIHRLRGKEALESAKVVDSATAAVHWLLNLQNGDGGIPTFCKGWGALPFDRSSPDITAHAVRAWSLWRAEMPTAIRSRIDLGLRRSLRYLMTVQNPDGSWQPLWFGNQHLKDETNPTYGTTHVLLALVELPPDAREATAPSVAMKRGCAWLIESQNEDGGWGSGHGSPSSIEETALAIEALVRAESVQGVTLPASLLSRAVKWLAQATEDGTQFPVSPIGFYFAKLWYHEKLYPIVWTMAAMSTLKARSNRHAAEGGSTSS